MNPGTPTPPVIDPRHLMLLATVEGLVFGSALLRLPFGGLQLERLSHVAWLVAVSLVAGLAIASFVVRSTRLAAPPEPGEDRGEQRRSVLFASLALLALAGVLSAVGPGPFERVVPDLERSDR